MLFFRCVCVVYVLVFCLILFFFFFKQKTAYEMRISDWSSDVCALPISQHVEVRRVGVYRYVNELAGKLVERTPIGWNRIIAAIGVEQIGLELQHRIKFCRPESAAPRNMCPFHLFLPARQLRRQRGTAILQFVGENWKAG